MVRADSGEEGDQGMKKKLVEQTPPTPVRKKGVVVTTQVVKDILILNIYKDKQLHIRYCINIDTGEYATLESGIWGMSKLSSVLGDLYHIYYWCGPDYKKVRFQSPEDEQRMEDTKCNFHMIENKEYTYGYHKCERAYESKRDRINREIESIQDLPEELNDFIYQCVGQDRDYGFKVGSDSYKCTNCGKEFAGKWKNNEDINCPCCERKIRIKKRQQCISVETQIMIIQEAGSNRACIRHIDAKLEWASGSRRRLVTSDSRIMMLYRQGRAYRFYYNQAAKRDEMDDKWSGGWHRSGFWTSNPSNRRVSSCYLYPKGIEALSGTYFENWISILQMLASGCMKLDYNNLLTTRYSPNEVSYRSIVEYLYKGRFYRVLEEYVDRIWVSPNGIDYSYDSGRIKAIGSNIEEVFGIPDRQAIYRIRNINGGLNTLDWIKWGIRHKQKISDRFLQWAMEDPNNQINPQSSDMRWILLRMSPEQIMHYIDRQKRESYPKFSRWQVISQYEDYMDMCKKLHKDTTDEMVYKPRELKRRHDEAVKELEIRQAELQAEEYSSKYPEAEQVLQEIQSRYAYNGDQFLIVVPNRVVDIVKEGNALHHCAGSTDRYFDRIASHETYICFLRKAAAPEEPFYTIEVEPGGTIRQHRGMYDEEHELDSVKPFLKEWQKVIKKRMTELDKERAKLSKIKREENIQELKEKNNTRVLQGLMEDFMEAV